MDSSGSRPLSSSYEHGNDVPKKRATFLINGVNISSSRKILLLGALIRSYHLCSFYKKLGTILPLRVMGGIDNGITECYIMLGRIHGEEFFFKYCF